MESNQSGNACLCQIGLFLKSVFCNPGGQLSSINSSIGGLCSGIPADDNSHGGTVLREDGAIKYGFINYQPSRVAVEERTEMIPPSVGEKMDKKLQKSLSFDDKTVDGFEIYDHPIELEPCEPHISEPLSHKSKSSKPRPATAGKKSAAKVSEVGSLLGKAGTVGLEKAVEMLDTLGSSMTSLPLSSGFVSATITKSSKIAILAFEVANTIKKGANLMQSLSEENLKHLKEMVLTSESVQLLVSNDMDELLAIAASDKREELKIFSGEVVRFGNRCKDPQWHQLGRYFDKLGCEINLQKQSKEEAEAVMQHLMSLVQNTAELYHEWHALDRFKQDYQRKLTEEENSNALQSGDGLATLRADLKSQRKFVRSLKKKSLWSKNLEEITEQLVDIVHFIHLKIHEAFGSADDKEVRESISDHGRLGAAGLALHYANIITQIDKLASRPAFISQNSRDTLYQSLPPGVKSDFLSKLRSFEIKEELTISQIRAEMERTLEWLIPITSNTAKSHHGFGWVGEWANTWNPSGQTESLRIETLHYADKEKTEACILKLVLWLHLLISQSRSCANGDIRPPFKPPFRSPAKRTAAKISLLEQKFNSQSCHLTQEEQEMLRYVDFRKLTPGISKSQEFEITKTCLSRQDRLSKSSSHSPTREIKEPSSMQRRLSSTVPVIDFDVDKIKALDVIDRVDTLRGL